MASQSIDPKVKPQTDSLDELKLRYTQLQLAYNELYKAHTQGLRLHVQLQKTYDELQTIVRHQQKIIGTVKKLYYERLQTAITDHLTGLLSHRSIMQRIDEVLFFSRETSQSFAILYVDIDHFQQINDQWSYLAGDVILQEAAYRLSRHIRADDSAGRYGGDQFLIILNNVDAMQAAEVAERLRESLATDPYTWEQEETQNIICIPVTASIGVALFPAHGETREALITQARSAVKQAKDSGRNQVFILNTDTTKENEQVSIGDKETTKTTTFPS